MFRTPNKLQIERKYYRTRSYNLPYRSIEYFASFSTMDLSDSDEDILPSMSKFNDMFSQVQREARQETSKLLPQVSSKSVEKKSSKEKLAAENKPTKRSTSGTESASKVPKKGLETANISEESRKLLEEMDMLTSGTGSSIEPLPSSTKSTSGIKNAYAIPEKQTKPASRRGGRGGGGRGRRRKRPVLEVLDLDDSEDGVQRLDATFDDSEEMVVDPVVVELYSIRIRWKNEVLRFKVPPDSKMSQLRMQLGERVSTRADDLVILDDENNEEISDNTPVTSIPSEKVLEAFEREKPLSTNNGKSNINAKNVDPNSVIIKLQGCGGYRERYTVVIKRSTHVKQLIDDYIEKFQLHGKKFKLEFDGEDIDLTETPESLDLESGDMIDVREVMT